MAEGFSLKSGAVGFENVRDMLKGQVQLLNNLTIKTSEPVQDRRQRIPNI